MITYTDPALSLPPISETEIWNNLNQFSDRVIVCIDDERLNHPVTFGVYDHANKKWLLEGFSDDRFLFKVTGWSFCYFPSSLLPELEEMNEKEHLKNFKSGLFLGILLGILIGVAVTLARIVYDQNYQIINHG